MMIMMIMMVRTETRRLSSVAAALAADDATVRDVGDPAVGDQDLLVARARHVGMEGVADVVAAAASQTHSGILCLCDRLWNLG